MDTGLGVQGAGRSLSRSRGLLPKCAQRPTSGGRRSGGAVEDLSAAGKNGKNRRRGTIRGARFQFAQWPGEGSCIEAGSRVADVVVWGEGAHNACSGGKNDRATILAGH